MKKIYLTLIALIAAIMASAQGWPANYNGVMLQGFSWNAYDYAQWKVLEAQTSEMKGYIDLVWIPQSGKCAETVQVMGYKPYYYFNHNSSFGTEDELRSMIKTFKNNGIGTIADVVINHRNTEGWFTFPKETYKDVTYQMLPTDICKDDDGGATATQAAKEGISLSYNNDEGEGFGDCRDLDHKSINVQKIVKAYLKFLKEDLGYIGFRYDMVKGFSSNHVGGYNDATGIQYSVGEYWDGVSKIKDWIYNTGKKSGAFDFPFHYNMTDAIKNNDWRKLNNSCLISDASYRQYAITFVENHDIQEREDKSNDSSKDPIATAYIPAANAFMIAMPGTPCIFQPHWRACGHELKSMIEARKLAGITNTSSYTAYNGSNKNYCANAVNGTNNRKLLVVVGKTNMMTAPVKTEYTQILSGKNYKYYLSNNSETAWADKASGEYEEEFKVVLTAVSQNSNAKLVYTTDGNDPTASSAQATSGTSINIRSSCTLKVGLLINGAVSGIRTYSYSIKVFEPYGITVYVNTDDTNWQKVNFHIWSNMANFKDGTSWPGTNITQTKTIDGKNWYYKNFTITQKNGLVNFVFCEPDATGKAANSQSLDFTGVNSTIFVKVGPGKSNGKYVVTNVTKDIDTDIDLTITENTDSNTNNAWYTLSGMKMNQKPNQAGIYIHQGKKVVIK